MTPRITVATAARVLSQLRRDPRTIVLLLGVPCVLVTLLHELFADRPLLFQKLGGPVLGLFPFISMFLVTSITMLRERMSGTLERLMTMPLGKLDLLAGYAVAFALFAAVQASLVSALAFGPLGLDSARSPTVVVMLAIANATLGMAFGLFVSAFARSEFQAVQFMPAFVFPQLLLCGLFVSRDQMASWLRGLSDAFPLTYSYDALARVTSPAALSARFWADVAVTLGATLLLLCLGALTLRRRTA